MTSPSKERLNCFIDETGNFNFTGPGKPCLYGVAFTFHDSANSLEPAISIHQSNPAIAKLTDTIHLSDIIAHRHDYANLQPEECLEIFWSTHRFARYAPIKLHTTIVDMNNLTEKSQLIAALYDQINNFIESITSILLQYKKVVVYYDHGQKELAAILRDIFRNYPNLEFKPNFDHTKKCLFQVSDMMTALDKINYKVSQGIPLASGEKFFLDNVPLSQVMRGLKPKRW